MERAPGKPKAKAATAPDPDDPMRPWKPSKEQLQRAHALVLEDVIGPHLDVLFVGINPGLYSAAVGHHFGRPGNRFWPTLFTAGFTSRQFSPFEDTRLLDLGYGITNVVPRATAGESSLSKVEKRIGAGVLADKILKHNPRFVAFVGQGVFRDAFGLKNAEIGDQKCRFAGARVWVLPSTSGLNAHYQLPVLAQLFRELREAVARYKDGEGPSEATCGPDLADGMPGVPESNVGDATDAVNGESSGEVVGVAAATKESTAVATNGKRKAATLGNGPGKKQRAAPISGEAREAFKSSIQGFLHTVK